jgi:hypothetical protein
MNDMGLFRKEEKKSLEERVRNALTERDISIVTSPPSDGNFLAYPIKGIGTSKYDDDGALKHFLANLDGQRPDYVSEPDVDYSKNTHTKQQERLIQVIGYASRKPAP